MRTWLIGLSVLTACTSSSGTSETSCRNPPPDEAACSIDADCTTVAAGCYCGAQPVTGVAVAHATSADACEAAAADSCALGCPNQPGFQADDGNHADTTAMILVHCASGTCKTYVP